MNGCSDITPFFSVVTASYNRENGLKRLYESLRLQEFGDWEWIVVDDASTDSTRNFLESLSDIRVRYVTNNRNLERSKSRNIGALMSSGKYLCFCDSDDWFHSEHLQKLKLCIARNKYPKFVFTSSTMVFADGSKRKKTNRSFVSPADVFFLDKQNTISTSQSCIESVAFCDELFDEDILIIEDTDLFIRISKKHGAIHNEFYGVNYYVSDLKPIGSKARYDEAVKRLDGLRTMKRKGVLNMNSCKKEYRAFSADMLYIKYQYSLYNRSKGLCDGLEAVFLMPRKYIRPVLGDLISFINTKKKF